MLSRPHRASALSGACDMSKKLLRAALWAFPLTALWSLGWRAAGAHKSLNKRCKLYRFMWTGKTGRA